MQNKIKRVALLGLLTIISLAALSNVHPVSAATITELTGADLAREVSLLTERLNFLKKQLIEQQLAAKGREGGALTTIATECLNLTRDLALGARDTASNGEVAALQSFLRDTGDYFYPGLTGYYGGQTQTAVQSFQRREGIVSFGRPDTTGYGAVGQATRARIQAISCGEENLSSSRASIMIFSPREGDAWPQGETREIRWTSSGSIDNDRMQIDLINTRGTRYSLTNIRFMDVGGEGIVRGTRVTMPHHIPVGSYRLRIASLDRTNIDTYTNYFQIVDRGITPSISFSSPLSSATWSADSSHIINWINNDDKILPSNWVAIRLLTNDNNLASGFMNIQTLNDGVEAVDLSNVSSGKYYFQIIGPTDYANPTSFNSGIFSIVNNQQITQPSTLTVSSPPANTQWTNTNGPIIQWSSNNIPAGNLITVELLTPSGGNVSGFSSFSTANDGSESGRLTNSAVATGWYYYRLSTMVNGQTIYGGSRIFQFTQSAQVTEPTLRGFRIQVVNRATSVGLAGVEVRIDRGGTYITSPVTGNDGYITAIPLRVGEQHTLTLSKSGYRPYSPILLTIPSGSGTYTYGTIWLDPETATLPPTSPTTYRISASAATGGTISPSGVITVNAGASQTFVITPNAGYRLSNVYVNGSVVSGISSAGYTFSNIQSNQTIDARFVVNTSVTHPLTITKIGSGTITSSPAGINCGATCSTNFTSGTSVTLTATAASGYTFAGWTGACAGVSTCPITMDSTKSVTATFNAAGVTTYTLNLITNLVNAGTITRNPNQTNYVLNTQVAVTANPNAGYTFSNWSGDCSGTSATCTLTMNGNKSVTANFTANTPAAVPHTFRLRTTDSSTGAVVVGAAVSLIAAGQSHTLGPTDASGYSSTITLPEGTTYSGTVTKSGYQNRNFGAHPVTSAYGSNYVLTVDLTPTTTPPPATYTLTTYINPAGSGTIGRSISGVTNSGPYASGALVTLAANRDEGYTFSNWSGDCSGTSATCTLTMNGNKSVTANFTAAAPTAADLIISAPVTLTVSPTSVKAGGAVILPGWSGKNQGNAATGAFTNGFYLSSDAIITSTDTYITGNSVSGGLAAGASFSIGGPTLTIPANTSAGYYYIGILIDRQSVIAESSENNNYKSVRLTVTR